MAPFRFLMTGHLLGILTLFHGPVLSSNPICERAMSNFGDVALISIGFDTSKTLELYTSVNETYYQVSEHDILSQSLNLKNAQLKSYGELTLNELGTDAKKGIYKLEVTPGKNKLSGLLALAGKHEILYDRQNGLEIIWKETLKYDYSLVYDQIEKEGAQSLWGYMVSEDAFDGTGDYVMYPLWITEKHHIMSHLKPDRKQVFYMESPKPSQFLLKHKSNRNKTILDKSKQLFHKLPRGFIYRERMYLFDDTFGCVYIIPWHRINLEDKDILKEGRVNVPYEEFFKCPDEYKPTEGLVANRCDAIDRPLPSNAATDPEPPNNLFNWTIVVVAAIATLLLAIIFVVQFCKFAKSKGSGASKSATSKKSNSKKPSSKASSTDTSTGSISKARILGVGSSGKNTSSGTSKSAIAKIGAGKSAIGKSTNSKNSIGKNSVPKSLVLQKSNCSSNKESKSQASTGTLPTGST